MDSEPPGAARRDPGVLVLLCWWPAGPLCPLPFVFPPEPVSHRQHGHRHVDTCVHGHTHKRRHTWAAAPSREAGSRGESLRSRLCPQHPGAALSGAATSSEARRHPRTGLGHRGQGDVGWCVRSLPLLLCLDPEPGGPRESHTYLPSHIPHPADPHLARGSHVLGQMAFGIGRLGGHVISGKSLERRDPRLLGRMERVAGLRRRVVQPVFPELKRTRVSDGAAPGTQAAASVHAHSLPPEIPSPGHPAWEASATATSTCWDTGPCSGEFPERDRALHLSLTRALTTQPTCAPQNRL